MLDGPRDERKQGVPRPCPLLDAKLPAPEEDTDEEVDRDAVADEQILEDRERFAARWDPGRKRYIYAPWRPTRAAAEKDYRRARRRVAQKSREDAKAEIAALFARLRQRARQADARRSWLEGRPARVALWEDQLRREPDMWLAETRGCVYVRLIGPRASGAGDGSEGRLIGPMRPTREAAVQDRTNALARLRRGDTLEDIAAFLAACGVGRGRKVHDRSAASGRGQSAPAAPKLLAPRAKDQSSRKQSALLARLLKERGQSADAGEGLSSSAGSPPDVLDELSQSLTQPRDARRTAKAREMRAAAPDDAADASEAQADSNNGAEKVPGAKEKRPQPKQREASRASVARKQPKEVVAAQRDQDRPDAVGQVGEQAPAAAVRRRSPAVRQANGRSSSPHRASRVRKDEARVQARHARDAEAMPANPGRRQGADALRAGDAEQAARAPGQRARSAGSRPASAARATGRSGRRQQDGA